MPEQLSSVFFITMWFFYGAFVANLQVFWLNHTWNLFCRLSILCACFAMRSMAHFLKQPFHTCFYYLIYLFIWVIIFADWLQCLGCFSVSMSLLWRMESTNVLWNGQEIERQPKDISRWMGRWQPGLASLWRFQQIHLKNVVNGSISEWKNSNFLRYKLKVITLASFQFLLPVAVDDSC